MARTSQIPVEPARPVEHFFSFAALGGGALALLWIGVAALVLPYAQWRSEMTSLPGLVACGSVIALVFTAFFVRPPR